MRVFPHNDLEKLASHLDWAAKKKSPESRVLVITESVFSMDGDVAPLREICELTQKSGALLLVDEAHALGVLGPRGRGLAAELGVEEFIDFQMGTFSKAIGLSGGYLCADRAWIDLLINRARSFIYSTAPGPALAETVSRFTRTGFRNNWRPTEEPLVEKYQNPESGCHQCNHSCCDRRK